VLVVSLMLGFFFGLRFILNTDTPMRVVESSSMSIHYNTQRGPPYSIDYFMLTLLHPFDRTLNVGDLIIIQSIDPKDLNTNYPNSDIIVYKKPTDTSATPIVHRIVNSYEANGTLYFQTKGDGNGRPWPETPLESEYDSNSIWRTGEAVPADLVEGRVIMRIPCFGWITLTLNGNPWILPLIVALILLLIVLEFIIPAIKQKQNPALTYKAKHE
jgi:signal peptidase I